MPGGSRISERKGIANQIGNKKKKTVGSVGGEPASNGGGESFGRGKKKTETTGEGKGNQVSITPREQSNSPKRLVTGR